MDYNFATWYSEKFPKENRRIGKLYSSNIEPMEWPYDCLSECARKINIESVVNEINFYGHHIKNYIVEGGVLVSILYHKINNPEKTALGIEIASRSPSELIQAAERIGLHFFRELGGFTI